MIIISKISNLCNFFLPLIVDISWKFHKNSKHLMVYLSFYFSLFCFLCLGLFCLPCSFVSFVCLSCLFVKFLCLCVKCPFFTFFSWNSWRYYTSLTIHRSRLQSAFYKRLYKIKSSTSAIAVWVKWALRKPDWCSLKTLLSTRKS